MKHNITTALLLGIGIIIVLVVAFMGYSYYSMMVGDPKREKQIEEKFNREAKELKDVLEVNRFTVWEGDSIAEVTIKGKGKVTMWYDIDNVRISSIDKYFTSFQCLKKNKGTYKEVFNTSLSINPQSSLYSKFNFEVNNLHDVVTHYDEILTVVKTFPPRGEEIEVKDENGNLDKVPKHLDEKYAFTADKSWIGSIFLFFSGAKCYTYTQPAVH